MIHKQTVHGGRTTHIIEWENYLEQVDAACDVIRAKKAWGVSFRGGSWLGRNDIKDADRLRKVARGTWDDGMRRVKSVLDELSGVELPTPRSIRRVNVWREDDGDMNLDRYMAGDDAFRSPVRRDMTGPQFLTILVQIGANACTGADTMFWRGAAALVLMDVLERQGYATEIIAYDYGRMTLEEGDLVCATWVKRAESQPDMSVLVNVVSPWWFRTANFGSYHLVPGCTPSSNYGSESIAPAAILEPLACENGTVWNINSVWDRASAVALCRGYLSQLCEVAA